MDQEAIEQIKFAAKTEASGRRVQAERDQREYFVALESQYRALSKTLLELPGRIGRPTLIPFGSLPKSNGAAGAEAAAAPEPLALLPARLSNPGRVTVHLGAEYWAEVSSNDASAMALRRAEVARSKVDEMKERTEVNSEGGVLGGDPGTVEAVDVEGGRMYRLPGPGGESFMEIRESAEDSDAWMANVEKSVGDDEVEEHDGHEGRTGIDGDDDDDLEAKLEALIAAEESGAPLPGQDVEPEVKTPSTLEKLGIAIGSGKGVAKSQGQQQQRRVSSTSTRSSGGLAPPIGGAPSRNAVAMMAPSKAEAAQAAREAAHNASLPAAVRESAIKEKTPLAPLAPLPVPGPDHVAGGLVKERVDHPPGVASYKPPPASDGPEKPAAKPLSKFKQRALERKLREEGKKK